MCVFLNKDEAGKNGENRKFLNFRDTPPKTNIEPKNWWFVDVSPFTKGYFQVPC